jgi:hypothetical protein
VNHGDVPDPVDLMLDGKFTDAADAYAVLYAQAIGRGDYSIGPDLLMGLQYCVAGMSKHAPQDASVVPSIRETLRRQGVKDESRVSDDLEIASSMIQKAKDRSEQSLARVADAKDRARGKE